MAPASAQTLRYANQGDLKSLDPYTLNESTTHAHLGHVYEGLIARDKDLKIIPGAGRKLGNAGADPLALPSAQGRQVPERQPLHRRRRGVLGRPRSRQGLEPADPHRRRRQGRQGRRPHRGFHPDLAQSHSAFAMGYLVHHGQEMGRGEQRPWRRRRPRRPRRALPRSTPTAPAPSPIESHQPGVKTVFKANPNWWRKPEHNLKEIVFTPIGSDATRVAALLSGEVDVIEPVPTPGYFARRFQPRTPRC